MLKYLFGFLFLANGVLLATNLGLLGDVNLEPHEPQRLQSQIKARNLQLLSAAQVQAATQPPAPTCFEWGPFAATDLARLEPKLSDWALGERLTRTQMQEVATHMVYIPSQGSKDAADKKGRELHRLGIDDFYVVQDAGPLRWSISLGVFKTEDAANAYLRAVTAKGVHSARVVPRTVSANKIVLQLRNLNADEKQKFDALKADFSAVEVKECKG